VTQFEKHAEREKVRKDEISRKQKKVTQELGGKFESAFVCLKSLGIERGGL